MSIATKTALAALALAACASTSPEVTVPDPSPTPAATSASAPSAADACLARTGDLRRMKFAFLDAVDPLRPGLWRYCRSLTPSVWDAEDLLQDTLLRAFATLGEVHGEVRDFRAYLHRIATNAWIDRERRAAPLLLAGDDLPESAAPDVPPAPEVREALVELTRRLPPQERVAVLLKDVFDFPIADVARSLETSEGAVKAALHRGRAKLAGGPKAAVAPTRKEAAASAASARLADEVAAAFTTKDVKRLLALMLPTGATDIVGVGRDVPESETSGTFAHTVAEEGLLRGQRVELDGEALVLLWYGTPGREAVGDVLRIDEASGRCARLRYYYFCPEAIEEVGRALGAPVRTNGCHY